MSTPLLAPTMISIDLSSGMSVMVARCCADPAPAVSEIGGRKDRRFHCDLVCGSCGQTLAVLRWRLERKA